MFQKSTGTINDASINAVDELKSILINNIGTERDIIFKPVHDAIQIAIACQSARIKCVRQQRICGQQEILITVFRKRLKHY